MLVCHPRYLETCKKLSVGKDYAVMSSLDFTHDRTREIMYPTVLLSNGSEKLTVRVELPIIPFYKPPERSEGSSSCVTRTSLLDETVADRSGSTECTRYKYKAGYRDLRCVIWPDDEPLVINSTHVVKCPNDTSVAEAFVLADDILCKSNLSNRVPVTVFVFDLDETCIDDDCNIVDGAVETLNSLDTLENSFVVLWSHGNSEHVFPNVTKLTRRAAEIAPPRYKTRRVHGLFDLIVTHDGDINRRAVKNPLHLYTFKEFDKFRIQRCVLIDDTVENATDEYTHVVVPQVPNPSLKLLRRSFVECGLLNVR
ncbi:hypothetical protein QAD02_001464 [Eretmocerus hayati]|uniref:Uncharacterized protein n=1 Tax=Eretmocerus hayati TaxID=131215 RepID=A0ACC2NGB2_9HYME|nr:hypothetical protein QAD02_001464 [Eretmocerus hayati]